MNFTIKKIKCNTVEYIDLNVHIRDDEFMIVNLSLLKTPFDKIKILSTPTSSGLQIDINKKYDLLLRDSEYPVYIRHAGGIVIQEIIVVFDDISEEEYVIAEKYNLVDGLSSISQSFDKAWKDVNNAVEYVNKYANFSNIAIKYHFGDDGMITSITDILDINRLSDQDSLDDDDFDIKEYTCHIIVGNETKRKFKVFIPDEPNKITVECIDYLDHSETKRVITSDKLKVIVGSDLIAVSTTYRAVHNAPMKY